MSDHQRRTRGAAWTAALTWTLADVVAVLVFAAVGRRTHDGGITLIGVLATAWPFLAAYLITAVLARSHRSPGRLLPTALVLWLGTVVGGLTLRWVTGAGVALSFQVVTLLALGILLLFPRAIARVTDRVVRRRGSLDAASTPRKGLP